MELKLSNDRFLGGVCGGIAENLDVSPLLVRMIWAFLTLITFVLPGLIVYIILWNTLPPRNK